MHMLPGYSSRRRGRRCYLEICGCCAGKYRRETLKRYLDKLKEEIKVLKEKINSAKGKKTKSELRADKNKEIDGMKTTVAVIRRKRGGHTRKFGAHGPFSRPMNIYCSTFYSRCWMLAIRGNKSGLNTEL